MKWSVYNQSLVRRGEVLISFDIIDNWHIDLKEMDKDKVGQPFHYPNTFLLLLGYDARHIFIFLIGKPKVLYKDMPKAKFHLPLIIYNK
jgi:hypothetical protein